MQMPECPHRYRLEATLARQRFDPAILCDEQDIGRPASKEADRHHPCDLIDFALEPDRVGDRQARTSRI